MKVLREVVAIEKPDAIADRMGDIRSGWVEVAQARAHYRFLRAGETVQAARLSGQQPAIITVHPQAALLSMSNDWRVRDTVHGHIYAITGHVLTDDGQWLEITAIRGKAA